MIDLAISVLALLAQGQQSTGVTELPRWLSMSQTGVEILWRAATILALGFGGLFTYYKFWKGREFARRVEPKLSAGSITRRGETITLQAEASAKNIGLSKVDIDHAPTCITVELRERDTVDWEELPDALRVFQGQGALEPNEAVGEPIMIEIANEEDYLAARLTLNFVATGGGGRVWYARSLVDLAQTDHPRLF